MMCLTLTTCQAENTFEVMDEIAGYLSDRLGLTAEVIDDIDWRERYLRLDEGKIDIGWICGVPYVMRADARASQVELLAAPVMAGERYQERPIYFSDVVVRRESRFKRFADLRGASWSYNEPDSQSGYHITRYHLAQLGEHERFFGQVIEAGSHKRSLKMVIDGDVDASAIDSTYLEWAVAGRPDLASEIRIVERLGPSPIPPWVIRRSLPAGLRLALGESLLAMHLEERGKAILRAGGIRRFVRVVDSDYDPIRRMAATAAAVEL